MKVLRKLGGSIYKRLDRLLPHPWQVYRRKGLYLLLNKGSMMDEGFIKFKDYEDALIANAERIIDEYGISRVLDIGSNLGFYTARLGQCANVKEVHSFEPIRQLFIQTGANALINGISDKWTGHNLAASDEEGTADIHFNDFYMGVSSLESTWTDRFDKTQLVRLAPIDSVLGDAQQRIFVKMDVEGWEAYALRGMQNLLRNNQVYIQVESAPAKLEETLRILTDLGYRYAGNPVGDDHYFTNMDLASA